MKESQHPALIFLRVTDNQTKLQRIVSIVHQHFVKGERLIIFVPNGKAASFVDELLWKVPVDSFLPHSRCSYKCDERVVIAEERQNCNQATVAINLCAEPLQECEQFETIYELFDQTGVDKERRSKQKLLAYEKMKLVHISHELESR